MPGPITIPATSKQVYLGGMAALNLPSPAGTGDWHMVQTYFLPRQKRSRSFVSGKGCLTDTNPLLGDEGIYDCTEILDQLGIPYERRPVYAASHARAIADLVLDAVMRGSSADFVVLDDWMPRDTDKRQVFALLAKAVQGLSIQQLEQLLVWRLQNGSDQQALKSGEH